jgi:galactokinase
MRVVVSQPGDGRRLAALEPVPTLLARLRAELLSEFSAGSKVRVSFAPGRLDVMGGIADYTGSLVCQATIDRAAAVALQERTDGQVQIFSFNLHDANLPFTFRIPVEALVASSIEQLAEGFSEAGRKWAGYLAGCLKILHEHGLVDLHKACGGGVNLAVFSTVPIGGGVSSSAAIEVATMMNLCAHFGLLGSAVDAMRLAELCQEVENRVVRAPCGIMDQVSSCCGREGMLLRLLCQPHELMPELILPANMRIVGIFSGVKHQVGGSAYGRTRCAAFMGRAMILAKMREMGQAAGKALDGDPMHGYLANLGSDDYKRFFRSYLPEWIEGKEFLNRYGGASDAATKVDPGERYPVQHATDHHVLESMRVRNFAKFIEAAGTEEEVRKKGGFLDKAGHLMYASHMSYGNDAMLGAPECDLLVDLARKREPAGVYGARITGGGCGGTVGVLCDRSAGADAALAEILAEYQKRTGHAPQFFAGTNPGAWSVGTAVLEI